MFKAIKEFFLGKPAAEPVAPYKVGAPEEVVTIPSPQGPAKCGCTRSSTGLCTGLHKLTDAEWAADESNPAKVQPVVEVKVDPVAVALDLEPVDFAATPAEPAKKPRKPKAPKEKALAKKPAVIKAKASKKSA